MAIWGRMKWALLRGFSSSLAWGEADVWVGRNLVIRENNEGCWGGGFFNIDFPGTGSMTADDEGGPEEPTEEEDIGLVLKSNLRWALMLLAVGVQVRTVLPYTAIKSASPSLVQPRS